MRAWRAHETGRPADVLMLEDVQVPQPGPGQSLVRVLGCAANFPDALMCAGLYQVRPSMPFTPGIEVCGEVVALGPGVTGHAVGDRVVAASAMPHGGFAEMALVDAASVLPAPDGLDDAEAAALYIAYQTAWFGLHRRAGLRPGETLLVHAASGGVGSAAVQLGKAAGARVIGVVGGAQKAAVAAALGADVVVDRLSDDVVTAVNEATGGRGVDVVFDPVGGDSYRWSTKCIAFEGRIVLVGFAGGEVPTVALNHALIKNYSIVGLHWGRYLQVDPDAVRRCHEELTRLVDAGVVRPLVSERLPLDAMADGLQRLADGTTTGRLVLVP